MYFERLTSAAHPLYTHAMELYSTSFPMHEQRREASQRRILADPAYQFLLIREGEEFVGELLCWETETFLYVEHFCIRPELRNRRYGQRALALLAARGKTVVLEIDPPVDETSARRKGFYERCGFVENPYPHVHPPYRAGNRGHELVVMSCPRTLPPEEYAAFAAYLQNRVMSGALED